MPRKTDAGLSLAERLAWALERSPLTTMAELARAVGVSNGAVGQWFSGETEFIRPIYLFRAARALGVEAEWLGTGEGPRTRLERAVPDVDRDICQLVDALPERARRPLLALLKEMLGRR